MREIVIDSQTAGQRFDKYLNKYLPNAGAGFLYKMLRKKNIVLNGKKSEGKEILQVGDVVKIFFQEETILHFMASEAEVSEDMQEYQKAFELLKGISVLYEDQDICILNKPQGILSQKAEPKDLSLNEWFIGYLLSKQEVSMESLRQCKPSVANRLDRNTSGIVLCGKSLLGSQVLSGLIKDREVKKLYHAIVLGRLSKPLHLEGYLCKEERTNKVTISSAPGEGDPILTDVSPIYSGRDFSLVEIHLITGKTHQIRAHLASIGHPIVGDPKYGSKKTNLAYPKVRFQQLHAREIVFPETVLRLPSLNGLDIVAPYPVSFEAIRKEMIEWQPGIPED